VKVAAIVMDTIRELVIRKTVIVFTGLITLVLLFFGLALRTDVVNGLISSVSVFGLEGQASRGGFSVNGPPGQGQIPIESFVRGAQVGTAFVLYPLGIFLSVFATASLVPRMLEKGTIDLLLAKPIRRPTLLLSRALGALVVAAANLLYLTCGLGLLLGLKTGIWSPGFIGSGLLMSLYFACLLSWVVLAGVLLRSTAISIMITAAVFFASLMVQPPHAHPDWLRLLGRGVVRGAAQATVETLYHALPATADFVMATAGLIWQTGAVDWRPIGGSVLAAGAAFAVATAIFSKRDY